MKFRFWKGFKEIAYFSAQVTSYFVWRPLKVASASYRHYDEYSMRLRVKKWGHATLAAAAAATNAAATAAAT